MENSREKKAMNIKEKMVKLSEELDNIKDNDSINEKLEEYTMLQIEEDDLVNGTDNLSIKKKELELKELKEAKEKARLIKKIKYIQRINKAENELEELKTNNKK